MISNLILDSSYVVFFFFCKFEPRCSYKIVLIKKSVYVNRLTNEGLARFPAFCLAPKRCVVMNSEEKSLFRLLQLQVLIYRSCAPCHTLPSFLLDFSFP